MVDITFGEKLEGIDYYKREGVYLIAIRDNKLAVQRWKKGCCLIGGGIEEGESHLDCIKREGIEETGHEVSIDQYIGCAENYYLNERLGYFNPLQFYYYGEINNKVCEPLDGDMNEFQWIPLESFEDELYLEHQRWAVKEYLKHNLL